MLTPQCIRGENGANPKYFKAEADGLTGLQNISQERLSVIFALCEGPSF